MKKFTAILLSIILSSSMLFSLPGLSIQASGDEVDDQLFELEWLVSIYLCGSDLESKHGAAVEDLYEMLQNVLPPDCAILIECGGSNDWKVDYIDPDLLSRFLIYEGELYLLETQPQGNMGQSAALESFLQYGRDNFIAENQALIVWNHGGGVLGGICYDENYDYDSLSLSEFQAALNAVYTPDVQNPPFDIIGMDACLMATIDTAAMLQGFSHYMIASEETESGYGWDYAAITDSLSKNPSISPLELSYDICNSFYAFLEKKGEAKTATLSVTDLTQLQSLLDAYEAFGLEALNAAATEKNFFAELSRISSKIENYGGNTKEAGYMNLADLGHFASSLAWMLPSAQNVLDALDQCVVYLVKGEYRSQSTGLSCYYVYDYDMDQLDLYMQEGYGSAFKELYNYQLSGVPSSDMVDLLGDVISESDIIHNDNLENWIEAYEGISANVDDEGYAYFYFGEELADTIADVDFALYYYDEENDELYLMGYDNDLTAYWEDAYFEDNFRGVWGSIDGYPVYMNLSYAGDEYNLYDIPILLNGEEATLQVAYDFEDEEWVVLGATPGIGGDENGMASKELYDIEVGDIITVLHYISLDDEEDFELYMVYDIEITEDSEFYEVELPDGLYYEVFNFYDYTGNYLEAEPITFEIIDGVIYTYE